MESTSTAKWHTYAGLFMITLATLMYEILLTRIFSVTMWYHFAFLAISVAMFGMTVGAILVYLFPKFFTEEKAKYHLALSAFWFGVSMIVSFLTHLSIPFIEHRSIIGIYSIALNYIVIAIPFILSGVCVCIALTKFPKQVSKLYAADLAGAALGCILLVYVLRITDGPTAVFGVAFLALLGAALFIAGHEFGRLKKLVLIASILLFAFTAIHTVFVNKQMPLLKLVWVRGKLEINPLYERWNSFSRIRVWGDPETPESPFGWGLSENYPADKKVYQLGMNIDANAFTPITRFRGNYEELDHLKWDITNLVHHIRPKSDVMVIGIGGGRDILSALTFDQKSVTGVEINNIIIDAVTKQFADYTGRIHEDPRVRFIHDEARSYIARHDDKYGILQVSLIDTYAATAAGAFVLSENTLYTLEAWTNFLDHLTDDGIMSFSRWHFRHRPDEMYRLTTLAKAALEKRGVTNVRDHIMILSCVHQDPTVPGVGTMLISLKPFSEEDINHINALAEQMRFGIMLTPNEQSDETFENIIAAQKGDGFFENFAVNLDPPTDDNPYFFFMLRLKDMFDKKYWQAGKTMTMDMKPVFVLGVVLFVVIGLTFLCIIVPLMLTTEKKELKGSTPLFLFFAGIGLGFMLVEISQMQRLIIFLGHPTYGLTVVLFAILLSSGLGSFTTSKVKSSGLSRSALVRLGLLLAFIILFGLITPSITQSFDSATTPVRILLAIAILFPLGFFMGMAFPLGMKLASNKSEALTPWLWGINGATSVCASVFAVCIALTTSISTSFWVGFVCYVLAVLAYIWAGRQDAVKTA